MMDENDLSSRYRDDTSLEDLGLEDRFFSEEDTEITNIYLNKEDVVLPHDLELLKKCFNMNRARNRIYGSIPGATVLVSLEKTSKKKASSLEISKIIFSVNPTDNYPKSFLLQYDAENIPDDWDKLTDLEKDVYSILGKPVPRNRAEREQIYGQLADLAEQLSEIMYNKD